MLWMLGSPETLLRRIPRECLYEWGQHMLLNVCYHTFDRIKANSQDQAALRHITEWRTQIEDAYTMAEVEALLIDRARWTILADTTTRTQYHFRFDLLDLQPQQVVWGAIIAALLSRGGRPPGTNHHDRPPRDVHQHQPAAYY